MEAIAVWRQYAGEIAADLSRYHHRRIADWHAGAMCSYEFLELAEFMPADGAFKTALRGGEPSADQWAWRQTANETAILRAGMVPGTDSSEWGSVLFIPQSKITEQARDAAGDEHVRAALFAGMDTGGAV